MATDCRLRQFRVANLILMPGESTLHFATLAVAHQQQAAAQRKKGFCPLLVRLANPETGAVPALVGGKIFTTDVRSELGMDVPKALPGSVEQSAPGFSSTVLGRRFRLHRPHPWISDAGYCCSGCH